MKHDFLRTAAIFGVLWFVIFVGVILASSSSTLVLKEAVVQGFTVETDGLELQLEAGGVESTVFLAFPEVGATVGVEAALQPIDQDDLRPTVQTFRHVAPPLPPGGSGDADGR